jgi:trimethylamine--corrinoid protein Co-methyltransferase
LSFIENQKIQDIHRASLAILERTGFKVENQEALDALKILGCNVDFKTEIARIPEPVVTELVSKCPSSLIIAGRNPSRDIVLGEGRTYVRCTAGSSQLIDLDSGECRMATRKDLIEGTTILDALPNVDLCGAFLYPNDEPSGLRDVATLETMIRYTDKHLVVLADTTRSLRWILKIAETIARGEKELARRPVVTMHTGTVSPLRLDRTSAAVTLECARRGIPVSFYPAPISGATAPVTLAGVIALAHAELLGCIAVTQSMNPGAPIVCAPRASVMNMRTGTVLMTTIEYALLVSALVELEHSIGLPTDVHGCDTESKIPDIQSGIERTYTAIVPYLAGTDIISGVGALESTKTVSIVQLVIDDEIHSILRRMIRGIEITDETLAVDLVDKVGIGGNYLSEMHTRKFFKREHLFPELFDRQTRSAWAASASKDMVQRAREKAFKILREHRPAPLDKDLEKELDLIMQEARKDLAG